MTVCQAKRGFFSLYDCPKEAASVCSDCNRSLCLEHLPKGRDICHECAAKKNLAENADLVKDNAFHAANTYRMRRKNLADKNIKTIYFGHNLNEYYDDYDIRTFDIELSSIADMADSPDELYFDS